MSTRKLVIWPVLIVLLAGFGGGGSSRQAGTVTVDIKLVKIPGSIVEEPCETGQVSTARLPCGDQHLTIPQGPTTTQAFHFTCNPAKGNLPLLDSICTDIQLYPDTMLDPPAPPHDSVVRICGFIPGYIDGSTTMTVSSEANGTAVTFTDQIGGCRPPPYAAVLLYNTAIAGDAPKLAALEPGLRCVDDPTYLCVNAIQSALANVIRSAERAGPIARLGPESSLSLFGFASDGARGTPGTRACSIPKHGPNPGTIESFLPGQCSVSVRGLTKVASTPTVVFTETWPLGKGKTATHTWSVVVSAPDYGSTVVSVTQSGPPPPQLAS